MDASDAGASPTPAKPLQGRVVVLTGSTGGLGYAMAEGLALAGCRILLNGLESPATVERMRGELERRSGVSVGYHEANVCELSGVESLIEASLARFGAVDILVNNAVVRHFSPIVDFPIEHWNAALAVKVTAAFYAIKLTLPHMRRRNFGRIFNMTSVYDSRGTPNRIDYVTTKAALLGLTRAVALENLEYDVTCHGYLSRLRPHPRNGSASASAHKRERLVRHAGSWLSRRSCRSRKRFRGQHDCRTRRGRDCRVSYEPIAHAARQAAAGVLVASKNRGKGRMKLLAALVGALALISFSVHGKEAEIIPQSPPTPSRADIRAVAPTLDAYTHDRLLGEVWKRPGLNARDRSIVTLAALIARGQTIELPFYLNLALDNGVKPAEISEMITHLAFYSGWANAISAVEPTKEVFAARGIGPDRLPAVSGPKLPLDEAAEADRATRVGNQFGASFPGIVQYTTDILFRDLWLRPGLAPRDRSLGDR